MKTNNKRIVITESEAVYNQELIDLYEITERERENGAIIDLFASDPDYFNFGIGNNHIHKIPFVEVLNKYIIVPDDAVIEAVSDYRLKGMSDKCKQMLELFFDDRFKECFTNIESSWGNFDGLNFGIAYRGGQGYVYSIWNYSPKNAKKLLSNE